METEKWKRLKALYQTAADLDPEERPTYLDQACLDDPALRKEVEKLLATSSSLGEFLEPPSSQSPPSDPTEALIIGTRIKQYLIKRRISSGGMGTVYEALQEQPRRTVAVKMMRQGWISKSAMRRFEYEAEILARLKHPNIAQVIEAGTHDKDGSGVPYFVMEYIQEARAITDFVWEEKRSTRKRLELFLKVCDAVHHGHQKGIIHRDLKPANILVDRDGQVKVIDFGVARAVDSDIALTTLHTDVGELIGTLQYMSPEQCKADPHDLDVRSDVYSLGVVLYELLCEKLPYDVRKTPVFEASRLIREQDPRRPSTINRTLRGDVETIVLKALEKTRGHRYQTMAEFGGDIRRHLNGEVILAKPAGPATRMVKLIRRNPIVSASLGVALAALVAFTIYIGFWSYPQLVEERNKAVKASTEANDQRRAALDAKEKAEKEAEKTEAVNRFFKHLLSSARPDRDGRGVRVVEVLEAAAKNIDGAFEDKPQIKAALQDCIALVYENLGRYDKAAEHIKSALEIQSRTEGEEHPDTLGMMNNLANLLHAQGEFLDAEALHRKVLDLRRRVLGTSHTDTLRSMLNLGVVFERRGNLEEAESLLRTAQESLGRMLGEEDPDTLRAKINLANVLRSQGAYSEAEPVHRLVLETRRRKLGEEHPDTLIAMNSLAITLEDQGRPSEAQAIYNEIVEIRCRVLGEEHPETLTALNNLATNFKGQGLLAEAEALHRKVLEIRCRNQDETHSGRLISMNNLANVLKRQGKFQEAEVIHREVLRIRLDAFGEDHPDTQQTMNNLANVLRYQNKLSEAETIHRQVLDIRRRRLGDEHPNTLRSMVNLANVLRNQDRLEEAETFYKRSIETARKSLKPDYWLTASFQANYGECLIYLERYEDAEENLLAGYKGLTAAYGDKNPRTQYAVSLLVSLYETWSKPETAAEWRVKKE